MNMNDLVLVSVDDHLVEPPDMFDNHVPAKYKHDVPKLIERDDGTNAWVFRRPGSNQRRPQRRGGPSAG